ncbi:hypothetical protein WOLCODRAFT_121651, partial [Wolfiporia cocos MD-104 SS10]
MRNLLSNRRKTKNDKFLVFFSTALLLLITIYVAVQSVFGEEMWIVNASFPGGQDAYLAEYASVWYQTMGTTASFILNLLADALMIFRCHVIYNDYRVLILPCIVYLGTVALGILLLYTSGVPSGDYFAGLAAKAGVAYYSTTIALNVISTSLICGRIAFFARQMRSDLNLAASSAYVNAVAIIIESALPYTLCGVAFIVSYGLGNGLEILFLSLYIMFTCISPQLIVMRVISGRAWTRQQAARTLSIVSSFGASQTMVRSAAMETSSESNGGGN